MLLALGMGPLLLPLPPTHSPGSSDLRVPRCAQPHPQAAGAVLCHVGHPDLPPNYAAAYLSLYAAAAAAGCAYL